MRMSHERPHAIDRRAKFTKLVETTTALQFGSVVEDTPFRLSLPLLAVARFLKLQLQGNQYFHLSFAQVFACSFVTGEHAQKPGSHCISM